MIEFMATTRHVRPAKSCTWCGGPLLPPERLGRPAVYCRDACRKAAYEARRRGKPEAFIVKVVEQVVVESHNLATCTSGTIGSPAGCKRVLQALAVLHRDALATDPKWVPVHRAAVELARTLGFEPARGRLR